ncbi:MAG: hypothetical protein J6K25_03460 [Thermoguttaceae bacterium]|nr:hypothetical protein [Thermoguttaceae bacterium]
MRKKETFDKTLGKKRDDEKKRASERRIVGNALRKNIAAGVGTLRGVT